MGRRTGFRFLTGTMMRLLLFATVSRPDLGTTQPPMQWAPGAFSAEVKRPGREADHTPATTSEVKTA